ncbi:thermonuclease family protein [Octadecabacter sp. CECT 8868]|uniref:thermonuclease family protein n=1 Tax=Octadecabacter algicola TaxID=2909342 RepID=UPI001F3D62A3|nr:thermonuclease family protein [Octadecabacter algicola]MCF2904037.1 thermonuclease family protein [Octadecabacter algicola]
MEILLLLCGFGVLIGLIIKLTKNSGTPQPPKKRAARSEPKIDDPLPPLNFPSPPRPKPARAPENSGPNAAWRAPEPPVRVIEGRAFVTDGDSLVIKSVEIRLFGVDAPELNHPFGKRAKWALLALCKGQVIKAKVHHVDAHGRTVAKCYLPDGRDLSAEMVKQGLAIDWPKFSEGVYRALEVPDARKKMWLADARQKGRMHVWKQFEAKQNNRAPGAK